MCEKCKIIRRHGRVMVICDQPAAQAAAGLTRMARISGVDIPREKRLEIALTYIYGIGLTKAQQTCAETEDQPEHPGA